MWILCIPIQNLFRNFHLNKKMAWIWYENILKNRKQKFFYKIINRNKGIKFISRFNFRDYENSLKNVFRYCQQDLEIKFHNPDLVKESNTLPPGNTSRCCHNTHPQLAATFFPLFHNNYKHLLTITWHKSHVNKKSPYHKHNIFSPVKRPACSGERSELRRWRGVNQLESAYPRPVYILSFLRLPLPCCQASGMCRRWCVGNNNLRRLTPGWGPLVATVHLSETRMAR